MASVIVRFGADTRDFSAGVEGVRQKIKQLGTTVTQMPDTGGKFSSFAAEAAKLALEIGGTAVATRLLSSNFDIATAAANVAAGNYGALAVQAGTAARGISAAASAFLESYGPMMAFGAVAATAGAAFMDFAGQVDTAMQRIQAVASAEAFAGNLDKVEAGFINAGQGTAIFVNRLSQIPGVSNDAAAAMQAQIASIHNYSQELEDVVITILPSFAAASGQAVPEALASLRKAFDDPLNNIKQFALALPNATAAEIQHAEAAQRSGNVNMALGTILALLSQRYVQTGTQMAQFAAEQRSATETLGQAAAAEAGLDISTELTTLKFERQLSVLRDLADKYTALAAKQRAMPQTPEQVQFESVKIVDQVRPVAQQMDVLAGKIEAVEARLSALREKFANALDGGVISDPAAAKEANQLSQTLATLQQQMTTLRDTAKGGSPVQLVDLANAQKSVQAGQDQLRDAQAILGATKAMAEQATDLQTKTQLTAQAAKQELQVRQQELDLAKARNALTKAKSEDSDGSAAVAEAKANQAAIAQVYAKGTQQRIEAETAVLTTTKQADAEKQAKDAAAENASYEVAKAASDRKIADIQYEVEMRRISAKQGTTAQAAEYANQRALATAHFEKLTAIYDNDSKQYRTASLEKLKVDAELAAKQLAVIREASQQTLQSYTQTFERVGSSVSSNLMQMIQGNEKFGAAVKSVATGIVESMLQSGVKMVADWAAKQAAAVALTVAGETAKTGAATAGETARTGVAAAGAAAQETSVIASFIQMILADAKATIAGVTAFLAPILGPAAPAAGAAAGAGVAALASFDVGSWQIPSDMIARVHQGEMIVPAAHTPWAQSLLANGGASGGGDTHMHFSPTVHFNNNGGGLSRKDIEGHSDTLVKILKAEFKRGGFGFR